MGEIYQSCKQGDEVKIIVIEREEGIMQQYPTDIDIRKVQNM